MLILKSYAKNKCNWQAVYADVLKDLQKLPDRAKALYSEAKFDKIRRRMSDQISKLVTKDPALIQSIEIKQLISQVKDSEGRFSTKKPFRKESNQQTGLCFKKNPYFFFRWGDLILLIYVHVKYYRSYPYDLKITEVCWCNFFFFSPYGKIKKKGASCPFAHVYTHLF